MRSKAEGIHQPLPVASKSVEVRCGMQIASGIAGTPPPEPLTVARQRALPERMTVLPNDFRTVADFIAARSRAGGGS